MILFSMKHANFVHLRVHSAYSLSEGAIQVKDLTNLCREMSMPAVAVTDTNNLFGALEFSEAAAKSGIQPIIGCQLRVQSTADGAPTSRPGNGPKIFGDMVFLAKDDAGYRNLLKLLAYAYLETDHADEPHITLDVMATYAKWLVSKRKDGWKVRAEKVNSRGVRVATGHHAGPGWVANRRLAMSIGKQSAHLGQAIDVGCLGLGVSAEATDPVVQVVDRKEQDVRRILGHQRNNRQKETIQFQYIFHDSPKGNVQFFTILYFFNCPFGIPK